MKNDLSARTGRERLFFTGSVNIIRDSLPSGLDMRVYACVSLHDGMSLLKQTGRGCYATFATLTAEIGCDAANLSRSLKRLVEWGYLTEERQDDRRRKTYRVTFDTGETWQNRQQSTLEIVGNGESENGGYPPRTGQHYISLKGLDSHEREKLDSSEEARFAARGMPANIDPEDNVGCQLARLERALSAGYVLNRLDWYQYLEGVIGDDNPNNRGRANRLAEQIIETMDDDEYRVWGEGHGRVDDNGNWLAPNLREGETA